MIDPREYGFEVFNVARIGWDVICADYNRWYSMHRVIPWLPECLVQFDYQRTTGTVRLFGGEFIDDLYWRCQGRVTFVRHGRPNQGMLAFERDTDAMQFILGVG